MAVGLSTALGAFAQGTAFTYQGRLEDAGVPANGVYDLQFTVFGVASGGAAKGGPLEVEDVAVTNGLFTVLLDFGAPPFPGASRWLAIGVRPGASTGVYTNLSPRQAITATPFAITAGSVTGPINGSFITAGSITASQLAAGAAGANLAASGQSAVASGGIVISATKNPELCAAGYVKLGTTQLGDHWQCRLTTPAPAGRNRHTGVWTGTELIIWGAINENGLLNSGGRFNPTTGVWTALATSNAPAPRKHHTAVWTGTAMIVWGGYDDTNPLNTGGSYNRVTDTWTPGGIPTNNAPVARGEHTAVWTGTEMIIWGGADGVTLVNTGGRYHAASNSWFVSGTSVAAAPTVRYLHTAVWTGTEMLVWGELPSAHSTTPGPTIPAS
jgi:hypothetical protein